MNFVHCCTLDGDCALVSSPRPRGTSHGYKVIKNAKMQQLELELTTKINMLKLDKSVISTAKSWSISICAVNNYMNGDVDNFSKAVMDIITKTGRLWHDDRDVCHLVASKVRLKEGRKLGRASYKIDISFSVDDY